MPSAALPVGRSLAIHAPTHHQRELRLSQAQMWKVRYLPRRREPGDRPKGVPTYLRQPEVARIVLTIRAQPADGGVVEQTLRATNMGNFPLVARDFSCASLSDAASAPSAYRAYPHPADA